MEASTTYNVLSQPHLHCPSGDVSTISAHHNIASSAPANLSTVGRLPAQNMVVGSAPAMRASMRETSLDVIVEENEIFLTQIPDFSYRDRQRLVQESEGKDNSDDDVPPEGVFVQIGDVEQYIVDYDVDPTALASKGKLLERTATQLIIGDYVSSDDEDYETDLEYDEEEWLNPDKYDHDTTGKTKYVKVCQDLGVTPVSSFIQNLQEREINLRFYGLSVASAKAISKPLATNTVIEKLNLEGNAIEKNGARYLSRILKENLYVTELVLSENKIGNEGAIAVCDLLQYNRCITKLDLSGNEIDDICAPHFGKVLSINTCLKHLRLAHNRFEEDGARCFKEAISNNETLELLDLNWNHFGCRGAAMLTEGLQENVGLKYFYMAMAGIGGSGCPLVGQVLQNNRSLLELDVSYCRIPSGGVDSIASGLRENDVLQVFRIGSNPFEADGAMLLLKAIDANDACAIRYMDLTNVFVKTEFEKLAERLFKERSVEVHYEGVLPAAPKHQRSVAEMVRFRMDPVGHLRLLLQDKSMVPSEVFHLNGPAHITKQDFTETVQMAQLDLTSDQINILFTKVQIGGFIDIENLLDLLENPLESIPDSDV